MKNIKKLLSIVMVLALVLSLGTQAFAVSITITGDNEKRAGAMDEGSTYYAYQLLTAKYERTDVEGDAAKDVYVYHITPKYIAALNAGLLAVTGDVKHNGHVVDRPSIPTGVDVTAETERLVLEYMSGLNGDQIRQFADAAFGVISKAIEDKTLTEDDFYKAEAAGDNNDATFNDLPDGYYLISETVDKNGVGVATSQVMLDTAGNGDITVRTKEDVPSSEKKVLDNNDTENLPLTVTPGPTNEVTWADSADHDIGDTVYFKLSGTLPEDLGRYEKYELEFHDKEKDGLEYVPGSAHVYLDDEAHTEITSHFTITTETGDGCTFHVSIDDVKKIPDIKAGATIEVYYGSVLSKTNAVIGGGGNWNEMWMEYTNNSYNNGKGTTPHDKVVVFTYDLDVNKVDGTNQPLAGAKFALYKQVKAGYTGAFRLTEDGLKSTGAEGKELRDGWYVEVTLTGNVAEDGKSTTFYGKGVDDGTYLLVETEAPDGYNKIDPKEFKIEAKHTDGDEPTLGEVTDLNDLFREFTLKPKAGKAMSKTDIINQSGLELPETGGIGTTIFYIAGAILVAGAVILLVTKRRVNGASK